MINVRASHAGDAEQIERILATATGELRTIYMPTQPPTTSSAASTSRVAAIDDHGNVMGIADFLPLSSALYIQNLAVAPAYRRRGAARALLDHIAVIAVGMQLPILQLATVRETGNVAVFECLDFHVIATRVSDRFITPNGLPVSIVTLERSTV
jgi:ribosomal protein S18 acetylase RimI-like enzyme